MTIPHNIG